MLLQINHGVVQFAGHTVLEDASFEIREKEKIAVVGRNGCGKTTLLRLIAGEIPFEKESSDQESGYSKTGDPVIGYLKQSAFSDLSLTMEQELRKELASMEEAEAELKRMSKELESDYSEEKVAAYTRAEQAFQENGGYYYEKEYDTLIRKFGFSEEERKKSLREFSGGQQTKIAFIRLLLSHPDILLLDEPTNHLDMDTIEWLEGYLRNYGKAVVVVSHDRMFLDRIAETVVEIEYGVTTRYRGNYSDFIRQKKERYEKQKKDYEAQQKEIKRLQELIERFKSKPTKAAMARSKMKVLERMNRIEPPDRYDERTFHTAFQPEQETGKDVLSVEDLSFGYQENFGNLNLELKKGEKLGIIGGNGKGKSTLLKTLTGLIPPLSGTYHYGVHAKIGYFDQQIAQIQSDRRVIDDFWEEFPTLTETEVRSALGAFLFTGEDVFKEISVLSGGEKVRLALCKIFKRRPNILILDEPTNHMDIVGKETLEAMLSHYTGTLLFVSHDRYFVKKLSERLLSFEDGKVVHYQFGYDEYEEKRAALAEDTAAPSQQERSKEASKEKKAIYNPGKERSKLEKKAKRLEEEIAEAEAYLDALKAEYEAPENQARYGRLTELSAEIEEAEAALLQSMEEWDRISEELEQYAGN